MALAQKMVLDQSGIQGMQFYCPFSLQATIFLSGLACLFRLCKLMAENISHLIGLLVHSEFEKYF